MISKGLLVDYVDGGMTLELPITQNIVLYGLVRDLGKALARLLARSVHIVVLETMSLGQRMAAK